MTATLDAPVSEVGAVPSFDVTLKIRRYLPDDGAGAPEPYWDEFTVPPTAPTACSTPCTR